MDYCSACGNAATYRCPTCYTTTCAVYAPKGACATCAGRAAKRAEEQRLGPWESSVQSGTVSIIMDHLQREEFFIKLGQRAVARHKPMTREFLFDASLLNLPRIMFGGGQTKAKYSGWSLKIGDYSAWLGENRRWYAAGHSHSNPHWKWRSKSRDLMSGPGELANSSVRMFDNSSDSDMRINGRMP